MGTQRTRLLCNAPTAVKPLGLAPRESRVGREVSGTLGGVEHRGRTESEPHCTRAWKACEGPKGWPQWGRWVSKEQGLGKAVGGLTRQEHWRQGLELDRKLVPSS